jgi:hypothetical protein
MKMNDLIGLRLNDRIERLIDWLIDWFSGYSVFQFSGSPALRLSPSHLLFFSSSISSHDILPQKSNRSHHRRFFGIWLRRRAAVRP